MSTTKRNYIFDFDSTLTRVEALDVLAEITLQNNPKKEGRWTRNSETGNASSVTKMHEEKTKNKRLGTIKTNTLNKLPIKKQSLKLILI